MAMGKSGSLKKRIFALWLCVVVTAGAIVSVYTIRYAQSVKNSKIMDTQLLCDSYAQRLENDLHMMQEQINWYFTSDSYFQQVSQGIADDLNNIQTLTHIKNNLTIQALILDFEGGYFFYNSRRDELRSSFHSMDAAKIVRMNRQLKQILENASDRGSCVSFFTLENCMYIFSSLSVRGCHIGYLMNLTEYFHIEDMTQIIYIRDNEIMNNDQKLLHFDFDSMDIEVKGKKIIAKSEVMDIYKLKIAMIRDYSKIVSFWQQWNFWALIIMVAIITFIFSLFFYHTMRQTLLIPIQHILFRINEMRN